MARLSGQRSAPVDGLERVVAGLRISPEDRLNPMPLWALVASRLQDLIESGQVPQGAQIESEVALAEKLGISRPTMRRAMQELVDHGLLVRRPGVGTQVVAPEVRRPVALASLYDDLARTGRAPRTEVLSFETVPATDSLALALRIPPRSDVTSIRRLRFADDVPLALMTNHIPLSVAKLDPAKLELRGLYQCIKEAGGTLPSTANDVIGARIATADECEALGLAEGSAVLTLTRTAWAGGGRGIEFASHIYRADRYAFEHNVTSG